MEGHSRKTELDGVTLHYIPQKGVQLKIYIVSTSGIFPVRIFGPQTTMDERKQENKQDHTAKGKAVHSLIFPRPPPLLLLYLKAP